MTRRLRMRSRRGFVLFLALLLCLGILPTTGFAGDTVTARWRNEDDTTIKQIEFKRADMLDSEGDFDSSKFEKAWTAEIPTNVTRKGYEFVGWRNPETDGYDNVTITAIWNPILSFDEGDPGVGQVINMPASITAGVYDKYGSSKEVEISIPEEKPSVSGANFLYWAETKDGKVVRYNPGDKIKFDPSDPDIGAESKTLVAQWANTYYVTYSWSGLPKDQNTPSVPTDRNPYQEGTSVTIDTTYKQDIEITVGDKTYVFSGWKVPDGIDVTDGKFNMPNGNVTITGTWTEKVTLTYNGNHSTSGTAPAAQTVKKGETVTISGNGDLVREGHTFLGWSTDPNAAEADASWSAGTSKALDADTTLYAVWQKNVEDPVYTLTYNGNGSTGGSVPPQQTANKENSYTVTVSEKGNLVRSGYTFLGWSTAPAATEADADWNAGTSKVLDADTILYAVWQKTSTPRPDPDPEPERPKPEDPKPEDPKPETPKPEEPKPEEPQPETPQPETPTPDPLPERPVDPDTGMVPYDPAVILEDLVPLAAPHLNVTDHFAYIIGYPDGMVKPTGNITRAEAATIFLRLMLDEYRQENWTTENDFSDVDAGAWYNNAVSTCAKAGIILGYPDGTFRPNANITRAEFAAIAARFVSEDVPGYDYFTDMNGHWAQKDVARAVMAGWIRGDGRIFRPQDQMSRAETATLVNRMINRFPDKEHLLAEMIRWPDNLESDWFYEDVQEATNSHDYEGGALTLAEVWTGLLDNRDWAALEVQWAAAGDAPGGEVAPELQNGAQ